MDEGVLSSFTAGAVEVFQELGLQVDRIGTVSPSEPQGDGRMAFVAMVGILGELNGGLLLRLDVKAAFNVVTSMYRSMGLPDPSPRGPFDAAIAELANQVCGRAFTILSRLDVECDMTPPTVIEGTDFFPYIPGIPIMERRTLDGPYGTVILALGLKG